jgi:hypothetical protein
VTFLDAKVLTENLEDWQKRLEQYPGLVRQTQVKYMAKAIYRVGENVRRRAPVYQGRLVGSIGERVEAIGFDVKGVVGTPMEYAPSVEEGTGPIDVPLGPLVRWVQLKRIASGDAVYAVAKGVQRSLRDHGIRAQHFFARGFGQSWPYIRQIFREARDEIVRRLQSGR